MIYLFQGKKESIKHIDISEEIMPKILIITYSNRNVNIFDYNNGDYIDSLIFRKFLILIKINKKLNILKNLRQIIDNYL